MDLGVSKNRGTRKSSILIGSSIIFTIHFGVPLFSETSNLFWEMFFSIMRRAHLLRKIWSLFSKKDLKNLPDFEDSGLQFRIGTYIIPGSKSLPARFRSIQGCISHIPSNEVPKHPKSCQIPGEFQVFWNTEKKLTSGDVEGLFCTYSQGIRMCRVWYIYLHLVELFGKCR